MVDQLPCGSVLTPAISCTKFKIHSAHADSPFAKTFSFPSISSASLYFTDQEIQEENHGGPTPLWVSIYTKLLCKVQDLFSTCRQPICRNISSFSSIVSEDQSMLHRPRNSGREHAWRTNSLVSQYLHQLSLAQSSRSIQRMHTAHLPKHFFFFFNF